jgi:hypothetical protein
MKYETDGQLHVLTLSKDEMISMLSLLYQGLELARARDNKSEQIVHSKKLDAEAFVETLKKLVFEAEPKRALI